jgi:glyoxylase-like metal-dependent hydrolase (beta-lactamase superfamily II)
MWGRGVLLFDALEGRGEQLLAAIREVTSLPVTTIVYSHFHVDHIGDGRFWVDQARKAGVDLRIVATRATADKMDFMASRLPKATVVLPNLKDSFKFENLTVESHRFEHPAHTDDHSAWLLKEERILHSPDLLNPDQLPVMGFAVSDTVVYHESNLKEASALDWRHFVGGHGNIGSREDFEFQLAFLDDLRQATLKARTEEPFAKHMIPSANNHAAFAREQREAIIKRVTEALRPKYGKMYGFEASMPMNVELAIRLVGSYY